MRRIASFRRLTDEAPCPGRRARIVAHEDQEWKTVLRLPPERLERRQVFASAAKRLDFAGLGAVLDPVRKG